MPLVTKIGEVLRQQYATTAKGYRAHDEIHVTGTDHQRLCSKLATLCLGFQEPVSVLDLGCGTGRHFHCLKNVATLMALDASQEMLDEAKSPVRADLLELSNVRYICGDLYETELPQNEFHIVYSLGVFGNGCALTPPVTRRIASSLRTGGVFYFDVPDASFFPPWKWYKKRIRSRIYALLPPSVQTAWDAKTGWPPLFIPTRNELERLLVNNGLQDVSIESNPCHLPSGLGRKFEITAVKLRSLLLILLQQNVLCQ